MDKNLSVVKEEDTGNTSLYGNRAMIQIGGRSQECACSLSKPDFQIPHRDLSSLGQSSRGFGFCYVFADLFLGG
jgi:hypothetical protein